MKSKIHSTVLLVSFFLMVEATTLFAQTHLPVLHGEFIVDDEVYMRLEEGAIKLFEDGKTTPMRDMGSQLINSSYPLSVEKPSRKKMSDTDIYEHCKKSVLVIGTLNKCEGCTDAHLRPASGFVIDESGIGVTSYHIFRGNATNEKTDLTVVAMDTEGNVYPVTEVLAADMAGDVAIFKFDIGTKKIQALSLGDDPHIGDKANVIGHPHNMFYSFTQGTVSRLYTREGSIKMSVTADFSQGSSGGPVLDQKGNVIGVVSATRSLYNTDKHVQMVSRETIPVKIIKKLLQKQNT